MPVHREAGAAVTARNGGSYVTGGDTTETGSLTVLRQVDVYDPGTKTWTIAPPMLRRGRSLAAALGTTKIYAIAGYNTSRGALYSVERFLPQSTGC